MKRKKSTKVQQSNQWLYTRDHDCFPFFYYSILPYSFHFVFFLPFYLSLCFGWLSWMEAYVPREQISIFNSTYSQVVFTKCSNFNTFSKNIYLFFFCLFFPLQINLILFTIPADFWWFFHLASLHYLLFTAVGNSTRLFAFNRDSFFLIII